MKTKKPTWRKAFRLFIKQKEPESSYLPLAFLDSIKAEPA